MTKIKTNWTQCRHCKTEMAFVFSIPGTRDYDDSDDDCVYQCPACKVIDTRNEMWERRNNDKD